MPITAADGKRIANIESICVIDGETFGEFACNRHVPTGCDPRFYEHTMARVSLFVNSLSDKN